MTCFTYVLELDKMNKYAHNIAWILIDRFVRLIVNFYLLGQVAKVLGPENFGLISFVQSIIAVFICVTSLGLDNIMIKEFSVANDSQRITIFNSVLFLRVLVAVIAIAVLMIAALFFLKNQNLIYIYAIFSLTILFQVQTLYNGLYQGQSQSKVLTRISLITFFFSSLFKIYLIYSKADIILFSISFVVDLGLNTIALFFYTESKRIKINIKKINFKLIKDYLYDGIPMLIASLLVILYARLDQWMIAKYLTLTDLGVYAAAIKISEAASFLPAAVMTSLIPYISQDANEKKFRLYFSAVYLVGFITCIGVLIVSPYVIPIVFGEQFSQSIHVMRFTIFSMLFSAMGGACTNFLIQIKKTKLRIIRIVLGLITNIILNIILIPRLGITGAGIASLSSQIVASWLGNSMSKWTRPCFIWQTKTIACFGLDSLYGFRNIFAGLKRKR